MRARGGFAGALICVAAIGAIATGCGGDDDETTATPAQTDATAGGGKTVEIKMGDFYFQPKNATAPAGSVTIKAPNVGKVVHELVLAKGEDPAKLPVKGAEVDEAKIESKIPGEVADVEAGQTKQATIKLSPGEYAMFCNIPGHYQQGMYGTLTVR
jgi:uncharacterized cupredoxin-like copper-binding protein